MSEKYTLSRSGLVGCGDDREDDGGVRGTGGAEREAILFHSALLHLVP